MNTPYDVLIDAKLAGTKRPALSPSAPSSHTYSFRSNEEAAAAALDALNAAGYTIVTKRDAWAAAQLLQGEATKYLVREPNLVTRLREASA